MKSILPTFLLLCLATAITAQSPNNTLRGKVLYQSSGSKPAMGVRIAEPDATAVFSLDNGDYSLVFQNKRNGAALALEIGKDDGKSQKLELVNEKEVKAAKLPASKEEALDIIVCPAGQRDIAAQKYYRILRTSADRELERKKKEVEGLLAQKEKDFQKISDLFAQLDRMQAALDSAKIREQAFSIASINLDRASQLVKDAVQKIEEENDVEGALKILSVEALDTAYEYASKVKSRGKEIIQRADKEIIQIIEGYKFKISLLKSLYKYKEAAQSYEKIINIFESEGYNKEELANLLLLAAEVYGQNADYNQQLAFNLKGLAIFETISPLNQTDIANSYHALAASHFNLGDYEKALDFNLKALAIRENTAPINQPELAWTYNNLAIVSSGLGDYNKALEYNQKALDIRVKSLPTIHPDLASSYKALSQTHLSLGNYQIALDYISDAIVILEKVLDLNHPDLAWSYIYRASAYDYFGEYQKAIKDNETALSILRTVLPSGHPDLGGAYGNLAVSYTHVGNYPKAMELHLESIAILENSLSINHPDIATAYGNLAAVYYRLDNFEKMLEATLKATNIYEKTLPADHTELATCYSDIGLAYDNLGEHGKALEFNLKGLEIRKKVLPKDHFRLGMSYANLAVTYGHLGDKKKSLECNSIAVSINEKALPANHPYLASSYSNIGTSYRENGDFRQSIEYCQKAIHIGESLSPKHSSLNTFYVNLGISQTKARQFPEAKATLEKSESIKPEVGVYRGWAIYYALQKKKKQAIESLQKAISLGFKDLKWLETEPDLKNIRKEKGFKDIVDQLKKQ